MSRYGGHLIVRAVPCLMIASGAAFLFLFSMRSVADVRLLRARNKNGSDEFQLDGDIAAKFFAAIQNLPKVRKLLSSISRFEGTLIEAWTRMKSFAPEDGGDPPPGNGNEGRHGRNAERDFYGEKA